jgi:DNA-binding HxlR family transcriptional regulator
VRWELADPLVDPDVDGVARGLADRLSQRRLDRESVRAIAWAISAPANGSPSIAPRIFTSPRVPKSSAAVPQRKFSACVRRRASDGNVTGVPPPVNRQPRIAPIRVAARLRSDVVLGALHTPDAPAPRRALRPVAASGGIRVAALGGLEIGEEPTVVGANGNLSIVRGRLQGLVEEHGGATFGSELHDETDRTKVGCFTQLGTLALCSMLRRDYAGQNCSIAASLELIGERWTLLIIRDAFLGTRRFDDFQARLGIARNVLQARLERLIEQGLVRRVKYQDRPPRFEYRLTAKGVELWPVLVALMKWGDKHAAPAGPPLLLRHVDCGGEVDDHRICSKCSKPLQPDQVLAEPGPGATRRQDAAGAPIAA